MRPSRFYSSRQEKHIAKAVGGRKTPNSGATKWAKGDIVSEDWLFEAKTHTEPRQSFTIRREWIEKMNEEAFQSGKHHTALVIDFGDGEQFYLISEREFLDLKEARDEIISGEVSP